MNDQLVQQVEDLGLSSKEARVYVANLMLGAATVQHIAEFADIKRVTAYVILESLVNLGLASQTTKGKKTYFIAEDPVNLKRLLDKKEQAIKDQRQNFDNILPDLKGLKNFPTESPNVKYYDSAEGIRAMVSTFLSTHGKPGETIYGVINLDQLNLFFPEISNRQHNPDRIRTQIPSRVIYTYSGGAAYKDNDQRLNRESRYVEQAKFPINGDLSIVGDHVVMLSLAGSRPVGVVIESRELAKTMLGLFNLAWEAAEKYNKD